MSLSASPALKQVESSTGIPVGAFAAKNYYSVFDIVRQSRKQFITANASWLGARSGKAWDLAMGQAQYIRRLFRESRLTRGVRQGLPHTLSGQPARRKDALGGIQGLVQDGPDWQNQFGENWRAYCQSGAPEACDSPVSYLTWLYGQALSFEQEMEAVGGVIIPLSERRPDLASMMIDNDAVSQVIPALQMVNEILEDVIAPGITSGSVNETLASTRYPTLLPYHFPHDQTELSLQNAGVPLEDIIGQTSTDWPWFLQPSLTGTNSNNATELASRLSPEQQTITTEPTQTDWTAFYSTNLGLPAATDYMPFENIDTFTYQLGITVPQVELMLACNTGGTTVTLSPNLQMAQENDLSITGEPATGVFGSALSLFNRQNSYAWFIPDGVGATTLKGDTSFSICMRVRMSDTPTDNQMPIISNNLIDGDCQGFTFCINGGKFKLEVVDSANTKVNNNNKKNDGTDSTASINTWYFICLTWDSAGREVNAYYQESTAPTLSTITVDMTKLTGDITTKDGFTWVLNDSGDFSYYNSHPTPSTLVNCLYDDIGVFDGVLTSEDAQILASSIVPLPQVSGLSISYKSYYTADINYDYVEASENYGASYINALSSPAVNLTLPGSESGCISCPDGSTATTGVVNNNAISLDSAKKQYGKFTDDANNHADGSASYSLGMWVNVSSSDTINNGHPLVANAAAYNTQNDLGIFIALGDSYKLNISISSNDATTPLVTDTTNISWVGKDTWLYLGVVTDVSAKTVTFYTLKPDGTLISTKQLSYVGSIVPDSDKIWSLNQNGVQNDPSTSGIISFDDVTVWNSTLSQEQIVIIVKAGAPAATTIPITELSDARMDRINRMVRLQRWLGLSFEETDLLLSACIVAQGTDNTDYTLNNHTLRALGVFRHWQQKYNITAFQFAAVLSQITPYAISPAVQFLDQVFNSPSLFDTPFTVTGNTVHYGDAAATADIQVISQLCAGLSLTRAQFLVLAKYVATAQGSVDNQTFPLTLDTVSAFYRLALIPRWLGLSFADGASLFSLLDASDGVWAMLAGVPLLAKLDPDSNQPVESDILDTLMALDAAVDWSKEQSVSWVKNYLDLHGVPETLIATAGTVNFVNGICQQLPSAVLSDANFSSVPESLNRVVSYPNGFGTTTGIVNNGAVLLDSAQKQYGVFDSNANTLTSGSSDYTIGLWVYMPTGTTYSTPVIANSVYAKQGIFVSQGTYAGGLEIEIYDSTETSKSDTTLVYPVDTWFYFALTLSAADKILNAYVVTQDGTVTSASMDYSSLTGSVETVAGNAWHLNEEGDGKFYDTWPDNTNKSSFDDVTVWDSVLTETQITSIVTAGVPAGQTLSATATASSDWMSSLSDLTDSNGLVLPAATDYATIHDTVQGHTSGMAFASDVDPAQVTDSLTNIIFQAMLTQHGIADSALAQLSGTPLALSPFLLQWAGDSEYRLLSDTLALNGIDGVTDPSVITPDYLTRLYLLGQRADITIRFSLTPAAVSTFLANPAWLKSDLTDLTPTLTLLWLFGAYSDWLQQSIKEDSVLAYLSWVNGNPVPASAKAASVLAALLDADSDEVTQATAGFSDGIAKTVADVAYVMRLLSLSARTGLSVTPLLETGALVPGTVTDTWDGWQSAGNTLVAAQTVSQ